jgi:hypothetical protein
MGIKMVVVQLLWKSAGFAAGDACMSGVGLEELVVLQKSSKS